MPAASNYKNALLLFGRESAVVSSNAHTHTGSDFFRRQTVSSKLSNLSGRNRRYFGFSATGMFLYPVRTFGLKERRGQVNLIYRDFPETKGN